METVAPEYPPSPAYGLRRAVLSPLETLAQSISTIAPTSTPAATIPLVCALAGNGTWLAYALATIAVLLVALCIAQFARYSSSPGSLYTETSPPLCLATPNTMERPRPVPLFFGLVEKNGSKILSLVLASMPSPLSLTASMT